jgi:inosose dehydratase
MNRNPLTLSPRPSPTRRRFLEQIGAAVLLPAAGRAAAANPAPALVGSNVYGWTQYAKRDQKEFDIVETISTLRDLGYDYLEGFMDFAQPANVAVLADQMKTRGLKPVSLYCGPRLHEEGKAGESVARVLAAAKVARECGFQVISCNPAPIGRAKTEAELATQVAALRELGQGLNALGLKLGIHHHLPEMADQAREFHANFRQTEPGVVGFCYDVHWVWKGGVVPREALREYGNRVVTWHIRQSRESVWWEDLDTGDIDYDEVARLARERALPRRFTVELALEAKTRVTRSVVENHRRSREFIRRVFGA